MLFLSINLIIVIMSSKICKVYREYNMKHHIASLEHCVTVDCHLPIHHILLNNFVWIIDVILCLFEFKVL